jgi:hypothetical protein
METLLTESKGIYFGCAIRSVFGARRSCLRGGHTAARCGSSAANTTEGTPGSILLRYKNSTSGGLERISSFGALRLTETERRPGRSVAYS